MNTEKVISIPLFLLREDPFSAYIVDNKLIGCDSFYGGYEMGNGKRAYNLLLQLFNSKEGAKVFPQELKEHFEGKEEIFESPTFYYLISYQDDGIQTTFDLSIDVDNKNATVLLKDCFFREVPIDLQMHITTEEAFILFANFCVNSQTMTMGDVFTEDKKSFDKEKIEDNLRKKLARYKEFQSHIFGKEPDPNRVTKFVYAYLEYILNKLEAEEIDPLTILRLCGPNTLAIFAQLRSVSEFTKEVIGKLKSFKHLSKNEIIIYYSFLEYINEKKPESVIVSEFYSKESKLLEIIRKEISEEFPYKEKEILLADFSLSAKERKEKTKQLKKFFQANNPKSFQKQSKLKLPLFVTRGSNFSTIVINNEILGCDISHSMDGEALKSFNILRKLDRKSLFKDLIPDDLVKQLVSKKKLMFANVFSCVVGTDDFRLADCLKFKVKIDSKNKSNVILDSITVNKIPINTQVRLSPQEAFILFANICCIFKGIFLKRTIEYKKISIFKGIFLKRTIEYKKISLIDFHAIRELKHEESKSWRDHFTLTHWTSAAELFVVDYLEYIYNRLLDSSITPFELLRLSGASILDYFADLEIVQEFSKKVIAKVKEAEKLALDELLFYFSFLESIQLNSKSGQVISKFYQENILEKKYPTKKIESENKKTIYRYVKIDDQHQSSEFKEKILQTVDLAKNNQHKIILVKSNSIFDTTQKINAVFSSDKNNFNYHSVWLKLILEKTFWDKGKPINPEIMFEQAKFDPSLTKNQVISLIDESRNMIPNLKKDAFEDEVIEIVDLFAYIVYWMKSDNQSFTAIINALIEISKKTVVILHHPENELGPEFELFIRAIPNKYREKKSEAQQKQIKSLIKKGITINLLGE